MKNDTYAACTLQGLPLDQASTLVVWGHGWGMDQKAFASFAESLSNRAAHLLVDFPGFGVASLPPGSWGTQDYADDLAKMITPLRTVKKILYVGHSFGGRVGIQLAAGHPDLVDGLFLLSSAGLPRRRSFWSRTKMFARIYLFRALKHLGPLLHLDIDVLRSKFGSADYRAAGKLREVFVRIVRENLTEQAKKITCPTDLVYGANDQATPPEIGERLHALIANSTLTLLPGQDHQSVLAGGKHVVLKRIVDFLDTF